MTEEKAVSSRVDMNSICDNFVLNEYFQNLEENGAVFIAVVMDKEQKVKVYFESDEVTSICRMFRTQQEVDQYIGMLTTVDPKIDHESMRSWETTPEDFSNFLISTGAPWATSRGRKLTAMATAVAENGDMKVIDIFWSNNNCFMV